MGQRGEELLALAKGERKPFASRLQTKDGFYTEPWVVMLQVINRDWILCHYTNNDILREEGVIILEERKFDYRNSVNHGVWTFIRENHRVSHACNLRVYAFHELVAMFEKVGFIEIEGYGSLNDEPVDRNRMMMWIIARKGSGRRRR